MSSQKSYPCFLTGILMYHCISLPIIFCFPGAHVSAVPLQLLHCGACPCLQGPPIRYPPTVLPISVLNWDKKQSFSQSPDKPEYCKQVSFPSLLREEIAIGQHFFFSNYQHRVRQGQTKIPVFYCFEYSFLFLPWLLQLLNWILEFLQSYVGLDSLFSMVLPISFYHFYAFQLWAFASSSLHLYLLLGGLPSNLPLNLQIQSQNNLGVCFPGAVVSQWLSLSETKRNGFSYLCTHKTWRPM